MVITFARIQSSTILLKANKTHTSNGMNIFRVPYLDLGIRTLVFKAFEAWVQWKRRLTPNRSRHAGEATLTLKRGVA